MPDSDSETEERLSATEQPGADDVEDESENDTAAAPDRYGVTTYGADFSVEDLCRMQEREEIVVPSFQRNFVWSLRESSRFIESLLMDWPVPGIFLAHDAELDKFLVIDGQQRLKSLLFFRQGVFNPDANRESVEFALTGVRPEFEGLTYASLWLDDQVKLDNYLFHATVVKKIHPATDDTSIYHIFERLNTSGQSLQPQEVRVALYHGALMDTIREINQHSSWRGIYGNPDVRLKDQELILRFLAFAFPVKEYQSPLKEYLNKFADSQRNPSKAVLDKYASSFKQVSDLWWDALRRDAFRPKQRLNAAVFDSMTVGLARRIELSGIPAPDDIAIAYRELLEDADYRGAVERSTSGESSVKIRIEKATDRLARA